MKTTVEEIINNLDAEVMDGIMKNLNIEQCKYESCPYCRIKAKLKNTKLKEYLDSYVILIATKIGIMNPLSLFISGFVYALQYIEIKELEEMMTEKKDG